LKCLTEKVEKFIKRVRWKALFFELVNELDDLRQSNYGFKTMKCPPHHLDLDQFENERLNLIQNISFKPVHDEFQKNLRDNIKRNNSLKKALIPADKSRNFYELDKKSHDKLYFECVTKTYKKSDTITYDNINFEAQSVAKDLEIGDKVECLARNVSFITLKDHKPDFANNPKCRLINTAKPELVKVSKQLLENINRSIRETTKVHQRRHRMV